MKFMKFTKLLLALTAGGLALGVAAQAPRDNIANLKRIKLPPGFKIDLFAEGWLDSDTSTYRGRPVDVASMKDGSMRVSDDYAGSIYRISYVN